MKKNVFTAVLTLIVFTIFLGFIYPLVITGIAQVMFPWKANGSLIKKDGNIIGSELIGQSFTDLRYFHGRPSSAGYNASNSSGTNQGPMNETLIKEITERIESVRAVNSPRQAGSYLVTSLPHPPAALILI
jgi:K+-transporting ATPase ATPase C chain